MTFEIVDRIRKELFITGSALYEIVLAVSERVNRKVQIIRLHWQASALLQRIDGIAMEAGRQLADYMIRPRLINEEPSVLAAIDAMLTRSTTQVHGLKQALLQIDARIRDLKLEAIHEDLIKIQQDLSVRSARIERVAVTRRAAAVGRSPRESPRSSSVHLVAVMRGAFLLAPSDDLVFQPDDIVVLIGLESELSSCVTWFTTQ
ncbi:MAG: TrkA C-terminal domain-containing protein [Nitrospira sp.]|nr:TrkA C-terminal domain-containing protein [Nitrospira sp.]MCP9440981.1 TrkA C-terminal domain-containing protein [Nitrospira sp.]